MSPDKLSDGELPEEAKAQALYAAKGGVLDLLLEHPELRLLDAETLTTIYLGGVLAGVDAAFAVLDVLGRGAS